MGTFVDLCLRVLCLGNFHFIFYLVSLAFSLYIMISDFVCCVCIFLMIIFVCLFVYLCFKERGKGQGAGEVGSIWEELGEGKSRIRIYCMKNSFSNEK